MLSIKDVSSPSPVKKMKINEDVLKQFVANLIVAHNLKLKGWISDVLQSDVLEHKIYEFAVRQAMEYIYYEVAKYDGREVAGHHFELEMISCSIVPQPPTGIVSRQNLKYIVDKLMTCEMIKFPPFFPTALKKKLLFNMLLVMMTTLTVFLGASECDILGHKIAAAFTHLNDASISSVLKVPPGCSRINPKNVNDFVEGLRSGDKTWLPVSIERAIMTSVAVIVLTIFEEIFVDFRVNLIGATVRFHLVPGPKHERMLPIEEYRSKSVLRGGNSGRKIPTTIIANWKEMSRGQYVEALKTKKLMILRQVKDIDMLLDREIQRNRMSFKKGVVDALALATGGFMKIPEKTEIQLLLTDKAGKSGTSGISVNSGNSGFTGMMSPGGHGRITEAYELSKNKMGKFLKTTKSAIPKSVKKGFGFVKGTKEGKENKENNENKENKENKGNENTGKANIANKDTGSNNYGMFDQRLKSKTF